jgi:hypothetical protein
VISKGSFGKNSTAGVMRKNNKHQAVGVWVFENVGVALKQCKGCTNAMI